MIEYKKGYKYQLHKTYCYHTGIHPGHNIRSDFVDLDRAGILVIKNGYAWDGASGPAIDTKTIMRGSLVHDSLYQLIQARQLSMAARPMADDILYKICIEDGMSRLRAWYVHRAVKTFGERHLRNSNGHKIYTAP